MITVHGKVRFRQNRRSRKEKRNAAHAGRIPRVARLMALAIRFDQMIRDGVVADQAELARLGRVTRARLTQIMNLLLLAPDIQEAILFLPMRILGRNQITERQLRSIAAAGSWQLQRRLWRSNVPQM